MSPRRRDDADHPPDEGRRARLLRAATDQLRAVGARRLSIEEVAAEAGVSKGAVYLEFPSKTALVEAAIDALLVEAGSRYAARMAQTPSPRERLIDTLRFVWEEAEREPLFATLLREEHEEGTLRAMAAGREAQADAEIAGLRALAQAGIEAGELRPDLDVEALPFVISLMRSLFFNAEHATGGRMSRARVLDAALTIFAAGLSAVPGDPTQTRGAP
ncbi:TetR/AcrR family transcriptional regulator [Myxococcota bacterium]|nr:TetR/AcrR family transcriptional regulator [Myxococcota bacterium]